MTSAPTWNARNGEAVFYLDAVNNIRRWYFYLNSTWNYVEFGPTGATAIAIGTAVSGGNGGSILFVNAGGSLAQESSAAWVNTGRLISTIYPVSGGGNLGLNRTFSIDTAYLINTGRIISTIFPVSGGGNLSLDRTFAVDTAFLVNTGRTISTVYPLSGGSDLSSNRSFSVDTSFLVNSGRTISTSVGLSGGGNLSLDRVFIVDSLLLVTSSRNINTGTGLSGGGNLSADRTITLVVPVSVSSGGTGSSSFQQNSFIYHSGGTLSSDSSRLLIGGYLTTIPSNPPTSGTNLSIFYQGGTAYFHIRHDSAGAISTGNILLQ